MGTEFEEAYVKNIQADIKYACVCLEELGFDSLMLITSKDRHMELGSRKGRRFIEDNPNYFEEFNYYCQVKVEKQNDNIAEADANEEMTPVSDSTVIIGPGEKTGQLQLLTPKKEPIQTKVADMTDAASQEIDFTIEINNSFEDAVYDGDESRLQEDIETDQNQNSTIDTNSTIAKRYGNSGKENTDGADLYEDKKPQVYVPTVTTVLGKNIGKLLTPKKEQSEVSEMNDITSQEIDFTMAITDSHDDDIDDGDRSGLEEDIEIAQSQDNSIDTNKIAKKIAERCNQHGKGKKAQLKKQKSVVQPAFEKAFEQQNKKQENETRSKCSSPTAQKTFCCDQCEKKYSSKKTLIIHQRKHTGDAPYVCPTCDKAFRSSSFLKSHSTIHSTELKYNCDKCDKAFAWKDSLRCHQISSHSNVRSYICDTCGRCFKDSSALRKHKIRHKGEKNHSCEVCGKLFMFKYQVTEHMRVHTGIKKFECGICHRRFATKRGYLIHRNNHLLMYVTK